MILRCLLSLALVALAAPARAVTPTVLPAPQPVGPGQVDVHSLGPAETPSCPVIYDNTINYVNSYYGQQQGAESLDDLHSIAGGALCSFTVGYNEPTAGVVDLTVRIYNNNTEDSPPGGLVGGPWTITGLPSGANSVILTLDTSPLLPQDVWFGVQFSTSSAGLLIADPPAIGTSHDYFYEEAAGYLSFGGNPKANFFIRLDTELATPLQSTTWGTIKSLYR